MILLWPAVVASQNVPGPAGQAGGSAPPANGAAVGQNPLNPSPENPQSSPTEAKPGTAVQQEPHPPSAAMSG